MPAHSAAKSPPQDIAPCQAARSELPRRLPWVVAAALVTLIAGVLAAGVWSGQWWCGAVGVVTTLPLLGWVNRTTCARLAGRGTGIAAVAVAGLSATCCTVLWATLAVTSSVPHLAEVAPVVAETVWGVGAAIAVVWGLLVARLWWRQGPLWDSPGPLRGHWPPAAAEEPEPPGSGDVTELGGPMRWGDLNVKGVDQYRRRRPGDQPTRGATYGGDVGAIVAWLVALMGVLVAQPATGASPSRWTLVPLTAAGTMLVYLLGFAVWRAVLTPTVTPERPDGGYGSLLLRRAPLLRYLSDGQGVVLVVLDDAGAIVEVGPGGEQMWPGGDVLGRFWQDCVAPEHRAGQTERFMAAKQGCKSRGDCELVGAKVRMVQFSMHRVSQGRVAVLLQPIDGVLQQVDAYREAAERDPLSGLWDARAFRKRMTLAMADHPIDGKWALLQCELDVTSCPEGPVALGEEDAMWRDAAERVVRVVDHDALVGRTGGKQLSILVQVPDTAAAASKAQAVIATGTAPNVGSGPWQPQIQMRVGVAVQDRLQNPVSGVGELVENADAALLHARNHPSGSVTTGPKGTPALDTDTGRGLRVAADGKELHLNELLRSGRGQELLFTPYADLRSCQVTVLEVGVRWQKHEAGALSSQWLDVVAAIPEAERVALDRRCLMTAVGSLAAWRQRRWAQLQLVFPVSLATLCQRDFGEYLEDCLASRRMPPSAITLAVPGKDLQHDRVATREALEAVRQANVKVAINHLQPGGDLMDVMKRHNVQSVLMGRRFLPTPPGVPRQLALLNSAVETARTQGAELVMHGVESTDMARQLRSVGVAFVSGPVCGVPVPTQDVMAVLTEKPPLLAGLSTEPEPTRLP